MQYTRLARAIALTMPMALMVGCSSDSNDDETAGTPPPASTSGPVVAFDPDNGVTPFPTNIYGIDNDGTLSLPFESDWSNNTDGTESANTFWNYYGSQPGWGTSVPIVVDLLPADEEGAITTIDATSLNSETVQFFHQLEGGELEALEWNKDYRAIISKTGTLNIEPLKPLNESSKYVVALTNGITDTNGNPLQASDTFNEYRTTLENNEKSIYLQAVISNLRENGVDESTLVYAADFTTNSILGTLRPAVDSFFDGTFGDDYQPTITLGEEIIPEPEPDEEPEDISLVHEGVEQALAGTGYSLDNMPATNDGDDDDDDDEAPKNRIFEANINLPYYLDTPKRDNGNCSFHPNVDGLENVTNIYRVSPQVSCAGAFSFWQTEVNGQASGIPFAGQPGEKPFAYKTPAENSDVHVLISIPKGDTPEGGWPVFMYAHGYGSTAKSMETITTQLAAAGFATIAIDQPIHGSRAVDIDGNGSVDLNAGDQKTDFVMGENLLTTRGFMQQTMVDYIGVRLAIGNGVIDTVNNSGEPLFNGRDVHMTGLSLGGITATSVSSLIKDTQLRMLAGDIEGAESDETSVDQQMDLKSSSMAVPGGGVASVIIQSPLLNIEVKTDFFDSAIFRLHLAELLDAQNGDEPLYNPLVNITATEKVAALDAYDVYPNTLEGVALDDLENQEPDVQTLGTQVVNAYNALTENIADVEPIQSYDQFIEAAWLGWAPGAERDGQAAIDPSDPTNLAKVLGENTDEPIFLMEAVGDGSNILDMAAIMDALNPRNDPWNPGDFVIPNQTQEMPLGGTDPLIRTMGLTPLLSRNYTGDEFEEGVIRGAGRYGYGSHMTFGVILPFEQLHPNLLPHDIDVNHSMVEGMITLAKSKGTEINLPAGGTVPGSMAEPGKEILLEEFNPDYPTYKTEAVEESE